MNKIYKLVTLVTVAMFAIACEGEKEVGSEWGHTEYYESSIFKEYKPVIMERTLQFSLTPDAQQMFSKGGSINFYISTHSEKNEPNKDIVIYVNGQRQASNQFALTIEDATIEDNSYKTGENIDDIELNLGIEFLNTAAEGKHHLYLGACGSKNGGISFKNDKADIGKGPKEDIKASDLQFQLGSLNSDGFYVVKENVYNPADIAVFSTLGATIIIFVLSIIISRLINSRIKIRRITITGDYHKQLSINGYRKVVLTSKRKKQGFFSKLYTGTILYEVHPSWTSDITIEPRNSKSASLRYDATHYACDSRVIERNHNYVLVHIPTRQKIEIMAI